MVALLAEAAYQLSCRLDESEYTRSYTFTALYKFINLCLVMHRNSFIVLKNAVITDVTSTSLNNLERVMEERNFVSAFFCERG